MSFLFFIMTISNSRFDRIASRRDRLEKRSEKLESRIEKLEGRLEDLDPDTDYKKIERIQNRIDKFNDRLDLANTRMVETMEILPQDEFQITHRGDGMFDIDVLDSPYDDTYVGGSSLKFSVSGVKPNDKGGTQRRTSSIMIHSFDDEEGSTFVGSSSFDEIQNDYPDVVATLYGEDNVALASVDLV